ncbi:hypothetical protein Z043_102374 [Scleropages formosus]|uniref:Uncharacterized protein n=1 Tax=Scleropages formosus TaxID=113540 RepID=A0A0P7XMT9_SCLFO|nr:hypothetical protein Z043_102374 [Scleropages formosus]
MACARGQKYAADVKPVRQEWATTASGAPNPLRNKHRMEKEQVVMKNRSGVRDLNASGSLMGSMMVNREEAYYGEPPYCAVSAASRTNATRASSRDSAGQTPPTTAALEQFVPLEVNLCSISTEVWPAVLEQERRSCSAPACAPPSRVKTRKMRTNAVPDGPDPDS